MSYEQISATRIIAACKGFGHQRADPRLMPGPQPARVRGPRPGALVAGVEEAHTAPSGNGLKMSPGYSLGRFE